jgi:L-lysine exporter family protein LysE/ArgO
VNRKNRKFSSNKKQAKIPKTKKEKHMIASYTQGFIFGLGAAVPLGPINVLIMSAALRSYPAAVAFGAGAMSADAIYLVLLLFGLLTLLDHPTIMTVLAVLGSGFLLYMSYGIWSHRHDPIHLQTLEKAPSVTANYLKGLGLTLLNPYTIVFWLSVSTYIQTAHLQPLWTVLGMFSGILLWITLMPLLIHKTKHLFSQKTVTIISIVSAGILAFFGLGMVVRIVKDFL